MLGFRQYLILVEAKIDDYKASETNIPTDHDPNGLLKTPSDIIDHFHSHNPTGDLNHTKWVVGQYKKGLIKQEDAPAMGDLLKKFNANKEKLQKKKIEQYKTHADLNTALQNVEPSKGELRSKKEQETVNSGSTLVHSSPNLNVYHVHNTEASRVLGKGMPWCTSRMDEQNMFNHYNNMSNNRFFIAHLHNEQHPYRKLGIGVGTGEFQDENNTKVEGDDLKELLSRNPELREVPHLQGANFHITKNPHEHVKELLENDEHPLISDMKEHPERYNEEGYKLKGLYLRQHKILDNHQYGGGVDDWEPDNGGYYEIKPQKVIGNKEEYELKDSPFNSVRQRLAGITEHSDILDHLSNDSHPGIRSAVARNYYISNKAAEKLIKDEVPYVRGSVDINNLSPDKIHDVLRTESNPEVLHKHVKLLNTGGDNRSQNFHESTFSNPNINDSTLNLIRNKIDHDKLLAHPNVGENTINSIWNDNSDSTDADKYEKKEKYANEFLNHPKTGDDTLTRIHAFFYGKHSKKIPSEILNKIINHPNVGTSTFHDIIHSNSIKNPELNLANRIYNHKNVSDINLSDLYSSGHITKDQLKAKSNKLDNHSLQHFIRSDPHFVLDHPNVTDSHIDNMLIFHKEDPNIIEKISKHKKTKSENLYTIFRNINYFKLSSDQKSRIINNIINHDNTTNYDLRNIFDDTNDLNLKLNILDHKKMKDYIYKDSLINSLYNSHGTQDNPELHKKLINNDSSYYGLYDYTDNLPLHQLAKKYNVKSPFIKDSDGYDIVNKDEFNKQIDKYIARRDAKKERIKNIPEPEPYVPKLSYRQKKQGMKEAVSLEKIRKILK